MALLAFVSPRAEGRPAELRLYDEVGHSPFAAKPVTLSSVREELARMGEVSELTVRINSPGGVVTEGFAVYGALRELRAKKTVIVEGMAASIASVIAMAGDKVVMTKGSWMMIHNPFAAVQGGSKDLRRQADLLDQMRADILGVYRDATGLPEEELARMVDAETWMGADEAVEKGFADEVADYGAQIAASAAGAWKSTPEAVRAAASKGPRNTMTDDEAEKLRNELKAAKEECEALKAKVAKAEDEETEEETEEEAPEDSAALAKVVVAAAAVTGETDISKLEAAVKALVRPSASVAASRKDLVSKAMAEGRLSPALRKWALSPSTPRAAVEDVIRAAVPAGPSLPAATPPEVKPTPSPEASAAPGALTDQQREIARQMGFDDAKVAKAMAVTGHQIRLSY